MDRHWLPRGGFRAVSVVIVLTVGLVVASTAMAAPAASPKSTDGARASAAPVAIVTVAGLDRLLADVDYVFQTVQRKDITDLLRGLLGNVGNLKGIDRKKPFGVVLYLQPGFPPRPTPIVFVPVSSMDDLLKTLSLGPLNSHKVAGQTDRYEIVTPDRKFAMRLRKNYVFIAGRADFLGGALPDPVGLTRSAAAMYDVSVSVNLTQAPPMARDMLRTLVLSRVASQRPRTEGESDRHHQLRRAMAERHRETVDMILKQATDLTIGWKLSSAKQIALLDVALHAGRNTPLTKRLNSVTAGGSLFTGLFANRTVPLTAALSWMIDPAEGKLAVSLLESARDRFTAELSKAAARSGDKAETERVRQQLIRLFEPLIGTARKRHLDAFIRVAGNPPGHFVLVGGVGLADGKEFPTALDDVVKQVASLSGEKDVQPNVLTFGGVSLHRIQLKKLSGSQRAFFGEKPSIYVGANRSILWFAVGGDEAPPALKKTIGQLADKTSAAAGTSLPFQLTLRASSWLAMSSGEGKSKPLRDLGRRAFAKGGDALRVDYRPTEQGTRLRMTFGEGFIRLLGLAIATQYDRRRP